MAFGIAGCSCKFKGPLLMPPLQKIRLYNNRLQGTNGGFLGMALGPFNYRRFTIGIPKNGPNQVGEEFKHFFSVGRSTSQHTELFGCFRKWGVLPPKSSILIGFSILFTIHFGVYTLIFGNIHFPSYRFACLRWLSQPVPNLMFFFFPSVDLLLLMEEILHHLGCTKPCK